MGEVKQVAFVSEAWTSPARTPFVMPSQDPNRMEVLVISALDAATNKQTLEMYTCIRDEKQAVVDLKLIELPNEGIAEGPLLSAFLSGFRLYQR